jgi:hypothetical protein
LPFRRKRKLQALHSVYDGHFGKPNDPDTQPEKIRCPCPANEGELGGAIAKPGENGSAANRVHPWNGHEP